MAKNIKPQPELIDLIADYLNLEILDREAFAEKVNEVLINFIVPRLYRYELEKNGITSPKKAPSDAAGTREVIA